MSADEDRPPSRGPDVASAFAVPGPVKRLFARFPLRVYPPNGPPLRAPQNRRDPVLYVFATRRGAVAGAPSFNPGCLKWQAFLKFRGVRFVLASSSNHASPSGALPFLLPAGSLPPDPVPSNRLAKWASDAAGYPEENSPTSREFSYLGLVDHNIRRAWLYSLYLTPNFDSVATPLYINATSSAAAVRLFLARELVNAATDALLGTSSVIDAAQLYSEADDAFESLSILLGEDSWFFGADSPGILDAAIFSYTEPLIQERLGGGGMWVDGTLRQMVLGRPRLVDHRNRILGMYF
ncbi:hypothetical protein BDY21DRAFT_43409 [Lineolata rhizophorae]|uniref:Thioredoxin-like fold domain-containing protein n=1 Tax=Lineolata rhizophorae TaxID=578093 RepID=A0A6A6NYI6_9PEZI|nr:hypothetical protein BDY21DRAFT_43409 [Lineolata rhizophorae]